MPSPNRGLARCSTALLAMVIAMAGAKAQEAASVEQIKQWVKEAQALQGKGQTDKAIPIFERALDAARGRYGEDAVETAAVMSDIGLALTVAGQFSKAEPLCRRALEIREAKLGNHPDTASSLNRLGLLYTKMARYAEAEPLLTRSVEIKEAKLGKEHVDTAYGLENLAALYEKTDRDSQAEPLYRRALKIRETKRGKDHAETERTIASLAGLLNRMARYDEAERLCRRALEIREAKLGKDHPETARSLEKLAGIYQATGRYSEAEPLYRRSLEIREAKLGKDHPLTARGLDHLVMLYFQTGRYTEEEPLCLRALRIREARLGKEHPEVANSLFNLGVLYRKLGRYGEAEPLFRRSLAIREAKFGKDDLSTASSLTDLGFLYQCMGRYAEAEPLYRRGLEIRETKLGKDHPSTGWSLEFLANLYRATGHNAEAEPLLRRCLEIREAKLGKDHPLTARPLSMLAGVYAKTRRTTDAELFYRRSLAIREAKLGKDHIEVTWSIAPLSRMYRSLGRNAEAEPLAIRAVEIHQAKYGPDHPDTATSLSELAQLYAAADRLALARTNFDESRRAARRYITTLLPTLSPPQQRSYLSTQFSAWSLALSFGLRHGPDNELAAEASAAWLANGKAAQQEAQAYAAQLQTSDSPETRPVAQQLVTVRQTLTKLKSEPAPAGQETRRAAELDKLVSQDRELTARLEKLGARTGRGRAWTELSAIRQALPDRGVLIDFARFDIKDFKSGNRAAAHYVAWVTPQRGAIRIVDLGQAAAIDALVADVQKELAAASKKVREQGELDAEEALCAKSRALAKQILDPLLALKEVETAHDWLLSPDGSLWLVPWPALPLPTAKDGKTRYVVEEHAIRLVTAGRDVAGGGVDVRNVKNAPPLIVADPDFDLGRSEAATLAKKLAVDAAAGEQSRGLLSDGLKLGRVLRLPGTAAEAESISQSVKGLFQQEPRVCVGDQALEGVVKATRHPRMLVLSTHGFFLPEQEVQRAEPIAPADADGESQAVLTKEGKLSEEPLLRCGLLLAACNDQPQAGQTRPGDDGVLTGLEVVGMDLRGCELVVLSACETGLGEVRNGEGVAGLRQAFQLAGAESVVATLWQIPDRDTALVMSDFFEHLAKGRGKAEGLRAAQLARIKARRDRSGAAHPFFWAAFTLTGQDKAAH